MNEATAYVNCLVHAQAFETFWAYYSQSGGRLYGDELRAEASSLADSLGVLLELQPQLAAQLASETEATEERVGDVLESARKLLKDWAADQTLDTSHTARVVMWVLVRLVMGWATDYFHAEWPKTVFTADERQYSARYVRWQGHLPRRVAASYVDKLVTEASQSETIVLVADIRKSQDLMTYAVTSEDFSNTMVEFIRRSRELIDATSGFFDKFTGDGFLVYFNERICKAFGRSHVDCFLQFARDERAFAQPLFQGWSERIRKRPPTPIGLAMGADLGRVAYHDLDNHLVAVGDAIVWASRMATVAGADEAVINNLLFQKIRDIPGVTCEHRQGQTKAGEAFQAHSLKLSDEYKPSNEAKRSEPTETEVVATGVSIGGALRALFAADAAKRPSPIGAEGGQADAPPDPTR